MKQLRISPELVLPIEAVTKKFAFFGQNGSGKTYGAMKLAELMLDAGGQIVVIDPVGKWYGLRVAENGKDPSGIEIPVFGGLHGDIPLESTAGELVADVIVDRGISAVLDVSQFDYDAERTRFIEHFARRIFNRKKAAPSAIHMFVEEAQEFLPMQPNAGEEKMLREVLRLGKIGRNHGFGWTLITPRPQEITTKARNLSEVVLAFQTNGTHERKAIAEWVKEKGQDIDVVDLLPKLKPGFAHAWSPSWLEFSGTVHISKKRTFDASATPLVGAKAIEARPLGSIDLEQLKKTMAATIEKAKADDPRELRKEIATLKKQLGGMPAKASSVAGSVVTQEIERAVATAVTAERKRARHANQTLRRQLADLLETCRRLPTVLSTVEKSIGGMATALTSAIDGIEERLIDSAPAGTPTVIPRNNPQAHLAIVEKTRRDLGAHSSIASTNGDLSGLHRSIVNALAELEAIGYPSPSREQVGFYVGKAAGGGYFTRVVGELNTGGMVRYPQPGRLQLTDAGRPHATDIDPPSTIKELHARVRSHLSGLHAQIFDVVVEKRYALTRDQLGVLVGKAAEGGYFTRVVGELKTAGVLDYPAQGSVAAADTLFPKGLI